MNRIRLWGWRARAAAEPTIITTCYTLLVLALLVLTGGFMARLEDQLGAPTGTSNPVVRAGTVLASPATTADTVWVEIAPGQPPLQLPYATGYVPVAGDLVEVVLMATTGTMQGVVIGGKAGQAGNIVINPNFYRAPLVAIPPVHNPPYHWFRHVASGNAALICQIPHQSYQRLMMIMMAVSGVSSGDTYAYSSPIPIVPGASYRFLSLGVISTSPNTSVTVQTRIAFFSNATDAYPNNIISETQIGSDAVGSSTTENIAHIGTVTAPADATHARVALRASHSGTGAGSGSTMYWSEVVGLRE